MGHAVAEADLSKLGRLQQALVLGVLAIAYFLAGKLGLHFALVHASASAVWPPTGIALAAVLLFGRGTWPGIFIGALLVNLTTSGSIVSSLGIAVGNTLEATVGASLVVHYAGGVRAFERVQDFMRFVLFGGLLGTAISATIGVISLIISGEAAWTAFGAIWLTWWLGGRRGANRHAGAGTLDREREFHNIARPPLRGGPHADGRRRDRRTGLCAR